MCNYARLIQKAIKDMNHSNLLQVERIIFNYLQSKIMGLMIVTVRYCNIAKGRLTNRPRLIMLF